MLEVSFLISGFTVGEFVDFLREIDPMIEYQPGYLENLEVVDTETGERYEDDDVFNKFEETEDEVSELAL